MILKAALLLRSYRRAKPLQLVVDVVNEHRDAIDYVPLQRPQVDVNPLADLGEDRTKRHLQRGVRTVDYASDLSFATPFPTEDKASEPSACREC